jgi:hypothetical protein
MTESRHRSLSRLGSADIDHHESKGPPDRGIGPVSGTEDSERAVEADALPDRAIHHDEGGGEVGRRRHAVKIEGGIAGGLDRREHHREIVGTAARHDRIDGDLLHRGPSIVRRDLAHDLRAAAGGAREHPLHALSRGGHHGQAIGHPLVEPDIEFVHVGAARPGQSCHTFRTATPGSDVPAQVST